MDHLIYHSEQWLQYHDERFKQLKILSSNSRSYNNYFNNINNVYASGSNVLNVTGVSGINIIGEHCIVENYIQSQRFQDCIVWDHV